MLNRPDPSRVAGFLKSPWAGVDRELIKHDDFYSVTFSGNAGRIVVRHWMQITLEAARVNLLAWFADLEITTYGNTTVQVNRKAESGEADGGMPPLALYRLACTSVREAKDLQVEILNQLYRAVLEGMAPPLMLLKPVLNRLDTDLCRFGVGILETPISSNALKEITDSKTPVPPPGQSRMALLRMILNRNRKEGEPMIEPKVFETKDPAYNSGRLLAVFDSLQHSAHRENLDGGKNKKTLNHTIAERYFGSASTTPNAAFSLLWKLHQHHLKKLRQQGEKGQRAAAKINNSIIEITSLFFPEVPGAPPQFPRYFTLVEQGRFALGFYQQMAARKAAIDEYMKKKKAGELKPEDECDDIEFSESEQ